MKVFPGVIGTLEMNAGCHASVGRINLREIQLPDTALALVVRTADVAVVELLQGDIAECLVRSPAANPRFHGPGLGTGLHVEPGARRAQRHEAVLAVSGFLGKATFPARPVIAVIRSRWYRSRWLPPRRRSVPG